MFYFAHKGKTLMDSPVLLRAAEIWWCKWSHDVKVQSLESLKQHFYCNIQETQTVRSINAFGSFYITVCYSLQLRILWALQNSILM